MLPYPRGKFFEDFEIGQEFATHGRTLTEADVLAFGGLTGDFNPLHFDAEYAKHGLFGVRIPHGLCTVSIASGLVDRLGVLVGTALACLEIHWKFFRPALIGDSIRVVMRVVGKEESSKGDRGIVSFVMPVYNQREEKVNEGSWSLVMAKRNYFGSEE